MLCTRLSKCVLVEWNVTGARALILDVSWGWIEAALNALSACWEHVTTTNTLPPFDAWLADQKHVFTKLLAATRQACVDSGARWKEDGIALQLEESKGPDATAFMQ